MTVSGNTEYGLASYVYTNDLDRAVRVTDGLGFAIIGLNDINPTSALMPSGGLGGERHRPRGRTAWS
jgi:succinate-semialdehyde dehydrogenase/glutarate-semialdehyde dehydrogenase